MGSRSSLSSPLAFLLSSESQISQDGMVSPVFKKHGELVNMLSQHLNLSSEKQFTPLKAMDTPLERK